MKVAIFGAGTMGSGIAQVFAAKGHTALMYASSVASAQKHKDKLAASLAKRVAKGKMTQEAVDALLANILVEEKSACAGADLIIRTAGEERLSNFLLWQAAYAEFVFSKTLWPDFTPEVYFGCLREFLNRTRRFGRVL